MCVCVCVLKNIRKVWGGCGFPLHTLSMLLRKASKLVKGEMESKHCGIKTYYFKAPDYLIPCLGAEQFVCLATKF